jgi:hypothetical protein
MMRRENSPKKSVGRLLTAPVIPDTSHLQLNPLGLQVRLKALCGGGQVSLTDDVVPIEYASRLVAR